MRAKLEQPAASNKTSPIRTTLVARVAGVKEFIIEYTPGGSEKGNLVQTTPPLGSVADTQPG
ncbi:MAG TPA: hypothetical protein VES73_01420 [Lamprocystis sp. (in: g-proteobacteria)]|nr:hypothetical protein [Lamprocystis sp. (in: g-proteobacteria)]